MPNADFQRHSFLGGEVSPSLYERADMDKFGKWFSTAENIRFRETGAFRNRSGFVRIADTKYNQDGQVVKLLSFAFNDEESFLVELGAGYARFYRNGQQIMNGDEPYELQTPFTEFTEDDLKYAQAGDTVFITHPQFGIYELARLQSDGSSWEFKKFNTDILPMKEENDEKTKTMSLGSASVTNYETITIERSNPNQNYIIDPNLYKDNVLILSLSGQVLFTYFVEQMRSVLSSDSLTIELLDNVIKITAPSLSTSLPDFRLEYTTEVIGTQIKQVYPSDYGRNVVFHNSPKLGENFTGYLTFNLDNNTRFVKSIFFSNYIKFQYSGGTYETVELSFSASDTSSLENSLASIASQNNAITSSSTSITASTMVYIDGNASREMWFYGPSSNPFYARIEYAYLSQKTVSSVLGTMYTVYTLTSTSGEFAKLNINDCVLVKHSTSVKDISDKKDNPGMYTYDPIRSDGNWRIWVKGNWIGKITIQYSTDNQISWVDYKIYESKNSNETPYNPTDSGSLITDDLVWFRIVWDLSSIGTVHPQFSFVVDSFVANSYYKILLKNSDTSAQVECIKNDIGLFTNNFQWRLPAFSQAEGWPQTVAFYQNRLFFGKDYIIYGSRNNDFWDFYEPVKLQADDPVTMSLLSQKVNTIRNLVTQRSFFTFTAGGEFGIGSEGALTQNDKYLKPFSANGSATCNPVLISDVVLFVDKSFNSIRALKYALEADGYEAPDITLTLRALLENERIISTDIIYEEKEALFLSDTGIIWVLKYITDQNVMSWSHWKHAFGKITNICVVPHGSKHDLYIAVEANGKKWIELMSRTEFMDTVEYFTATEDAKVTVSGIPGYQKAVLQGDKRYFVTIDANNQIDAPEDTTQGFKVGSVYVSTATMLSPVLQASEYSHMNYEVKNPFKVFFYYLNSYGFKVGVEEDEKMEIEWQPVNADIDDEIDLTSGKKSVLIPSRFEGSARVSFMQNEPFPMEVADVLIQTDYGGK